MRKIGHNDQSDNFNFLKKLSGWIQCFSTTSWMFMSYYAKNIRADDDRGLMNYVDDVEATVGKPGIGEKVKQKYRWITGRTSMWWLVQREAIETYLWRNGVAGKIIFRDGDMLISSLPSVLRMGPVILGTHKMGGLPGGHIILAVDYDASIRSIIGNDPAGNARNKYADRHKKNSGHNVIYSLDWIRPYLKVPGVKDGYCRCMYWRP
jgi:hypothetical protein